MRVVKVRLTTSQTEEESTGVYIGHIRDGEPFGVGLMHTSPTVKIFGKFNGLRTSGLVHKKDARQHYETLCNYSAEQKRAGVFYGEKPGEKVLEQWVEGRQRGWLYHFSNGMTVKGWSAGGRLSGFCTIDADSATGFKGSVREDAYHGKGRLREDDFEYEGSFVAGLKHGLGRESGAAGQAYAGEWVNGRMSGWGLQRLPEGVEYRGGLKDGLKSGVGVYSIGEHYRFVGSFAEDEPEGLGLLQTDAVYYLGHWHRGQKHGLGYQRTLKAPAQSYFGHWAANKKEGIGLLYEDGGEQGGFTDGFFGHFFDNQLHGVAIPVKNNKLFKNEAHAYKEGARQGVASFSRIGDLSLRFQRLDFSGFCLESLQQVDQLEALVKEREQVVRAAEKIDIDQEFAAEAERLEEGIRLLEEEYENMRAQHQAELNDFYGEADRAGIDVDSVVNDMLLPEDLLAQLQEKKTDPAAKLSAHLDSQDNHINKSFGRTSFENQPEEPQDSPGLRGEPQKVVEFLRDRSSHALVSEDAAVLYSVHKQVTAEDIRAELEAAAKKRKANPQAPQEPRKPPIKRLERQNQVSRLQAHTKAKASIKEVDDDDTDEEILAQIGRQGSRARTADHRDYRALGVEEVDEAQAPPKSEQTRKQASPQTPPAQPARLRSRSNRRKEESPQEAIKRLEKTGLSATVLKEFEKVKKKYHLIAKKGGRK